MTDINNLITDNIDVWTSAIKKRNSQGRGSSKKIELTGIKKLRELILDLAVRGKLVPQDPNDEPASVLLEKIVKEKAQLIADNKIKKQKPLPELSVDEVDFDLPTGWAIAYIPEVVAYDKYAIKRGPFGSTLKKAYFVPDGVKVYEQQHAIRDDFSLGEYYITDEKFKELSAFEVKANDLIISCSGTVGKVAVAPVWMHKGIINQALLKITLNELVLTNSYFKILFPAFYMQTDTLSDLKGTAQKNMVSVDTLKKEPFPLPSIVEQHRIVAKVDELMALCDQLEQQTEESLSAHQTLVEVLLATLTESNSAEDFQTSWQRIAEHFDLLFTTEHSIEQLKKTILQLAVMGKLVPQNSSDEPASVLLAKIAEEKVQLIADKKIKNPKPMLAITVEEKPFELPKGWAQCCLAELVPQFQNGASSRGDSQGKDIVVLRLADIKNGKVSLADTRSIVISEKSIERYTLEKGDVLIIRVNGSADIVGRFITCHQNYDAIYCDHFIRMRFPIECFSSSYLSLLGSSSLIRDRISDLFVSTAGQKTVNQTHIGSLTVTLPPLAEQHRIVAKVDELMALCEQLKAHLSDVQTTQLHLADAVVENALG